MISKKLDKEELYQFFDCGWSGDDYKPPCDFTETCSAVKKCLQARRLIRKLIEKAEVEDIKNKEKS